MKNLVSNFCKHIDGIAFFIACFFCYQLIETNREMQLDFKHSSEMQHQKIEILATELKASNDISLQRLNDLTMMRQDMAFLRSTIVNQNNALIKISNDQKAYIEISEQWLKEAKKQTAPSKKGSKK